MPYLKGSPTKRYNLPSDSSYWVDLKTRLTYGDRTAATGAMIRIETVNINEVPIERTSQVRPNDDGETGTLTETDMPAFLEMRLVSAIAAWNLTDANDEVLPINSSTIKMLDEEDGEFLQATLRELLPVRKPRGPFGKQSPTQSAATQASSNRRPRLVAPSNAS